MGFLIPKNWQQFQHYKHRNPPWIRLYRGLLDDRDFQCLPIASMALAPMLWLIASEHPDGVFDGSAENLSFRLRWKISDIEKGLKPLLDKGFMLICDIDASTLLARRLRHAMPETETETETELKSPLVKGKVRRKKKEKPNHTENGIANEIFAGGMT